MSRLFYHVMQDNAGNLLFDVSGTMRLAGTGTLATIYGDEALTVILPNPMTNHPSFASFKCYLGASASGYDFYLAKPGYSFETLTGVQGLGSMAQQDAATVAITGGSVSGLTTLSAPATVQFWGLQVSDRAGNDVIAVNSGINAAGGTGRYGLGHFGDAPSYLGGTLQVMGRVGVNAPVPASEMVEIQHNKSAYHALKIRPTGTDAGTTWALSFTNVAGAAIGSISTTAAATAYNTSSDARLKKSITPLTGALAVVQALNPVHFLWNANDEPGEGFLAHELMRHIPAAVSGEPDAVNEDGSVKPQQVDHSKLVPWLTAALQETLAQVQTLAARVASLEEALGV